MRIIVTTLLLTVSLFLTSAVYMPVSIPVTHESIAGKYEGTVTLSGDTWIIQVKEDNETIDFMPLNLSPEFKIEGLKVIFSAYAVDPPENVRLVGKPIKITAIKRL